MTAALRDRTLTVGQVDGWRAWRLRRRGSRVALLPNGRGAAWPPRRPAVATCWRVRRHRAPEPACTCGLYAVGDPAALKAARSPAVVGTIALWGTVVEHASRLSRAARVPAASRARLSRLLFQRGIIDANFDVVAAHRDGASSRCASATIGSRFDLTSHRSRRYRHHGSRGAERRLRSSRSFRASWESATRHYGCSAVRAVRSSDVPSYPSVWTQVVQAGTRSRPENPHSSGVSVQASGLIQAGKPPSIIRPVSL